jgi:predicted SAM-dependent methyltransferase
MKLNLGCGKNIKSGYVNLDIALLPGVDVVCDLNRGWLPFKESRFDEVYIRHVLEHLEGFSSVIEDIVRILKPEGLLKVEAPHCSSSTAYSDPTHRRFFAYNTFRYFTDNYVFNYYSQARVEVTQVKLIFATGRLKSLNWIVNPFVNMAPNLYERFLMWRFPVEAVEYTLRTIK